MPSHEYLTGFACARASIGLAASLFLSLAACGGAADDEAHVVDTSSNAAQAASRSPLYLIATSLGEEDATTTYLVLSKTFDASTKIDPKNGIPLHGGVIPLVRRGSVYVSESGSSSIARYEVGPNDALVKKAELSFAPAGLSEVVSWYTYIVSDTKAYVFDPEGLRIIVWNPTTMALTGTQIDLKSLGRPGFAPSLALEHSGPRLRGTELFVPTSWTDADGRYRHATGVTVIDTAADRLVTVSEDQRCGEAYMSVAAPNGDLYFFPSADSSLPHYFEDNHRPTCVLRVKRDARTFDPAYTLDLSSLGKGTAAIGAVPDGASGFFFATADQALYDAREENGGAFFRFWHYDFSTQSARPASSLPAWTRSTYYVDVGGKAVIPRWIETPSGYQTTLYATSGASDPKPLFSFDASWYGVSQLR